MMLLIGMRKRRINRILPDIINKHKNKGFTLIELALVAFLIALLVGLSTPQFRKTFSSLELKNASYNISKLINYAQETAVVEGIEYKINIDFASGRYWLTRRSKTDEALLYSRINNKFGRIFTIPAGMAIGGRKNEIVFYPDGRCDKAEIILTNKDEEGYTVTMAGFGNEVQIKEIKEE